MKRDRMWAPVEPWSSAAMKHWRYDALHAATAGALVFLMQRCAPDASLVKSLLWTLAFGGCAAGLSRMQSHR